MHWSLHFFILWKMISPAILRLSRIYQGLDPRFSWKMVILPCQHCLSIDTLWNCINGELVTLLENKSILLFIKEIFCQWNMAHCWAEGIRTSRFKMGLVIHRKGAVCWLMPLVLLLLYEWVPSKHTSLINSGMHLKMNMSI